MKEKDRRIKEYEEVQEAVRIAKLKDAEDYKKLQQMQEENMRANAINNWALKEAISRYVRKYREIKFSMHYCPDLDDKFIIKAQQELVKDLERIEDTVIKYLTKEQVKIINNNLGFKAIK